MWRCVAADKFKPSGRADRNPNIRRSVTREGRPTRELSTVPPSGRGTNLSRLARLELRCAQGRHSYVINH
jgi:hypothetical protein